MAWVPNREITSVSAAPQWGQRSPPGRSGVGRGPSAPRAGLPPRAGGMVATLLQPAQHVEGAGVDPAGPAAATARVPGGPVDVQVGGARLQPLLEPCPELGRTQRQRPPAVQLD